MLTAIDSAEVAPNTLDSVDETLEDIVQEFERLGQYSHIAPKDGLHLAISLTHRSMRAMAELQELGWSRERIRALLEPAKRVHAESPFIRRLQTWPRGYAGDFETIEYLMRQENHAEPGRLAFWLEQYALDASLSQQHRNKVDLQARVILDAVLGGANDEEAPRILVLAAGASPDLRQVQDLLARRSFHAVLLDQDADALAFSQQALPLIADRLTLVRRNVVRGLRDVRAHGPFNLVLAGGLFDYLPDPVAVLVLRQAREHLLAPGGRFVFTNISDANLCRPWMEHLTDWTLIHRTTTDVRDLCTAAGFAPEAVSLMRERTGLTLVATCEADRP